MLDKDEILEKVKGFLKVEMSETAYKTWIENLEIDCINDHEIILVAFSELQKSRIEVFYSNYISEVFNLYMNKFYKIKVIVNRRKPNNEENYEILSKEEVLERVKKLLKEEMTDLSYTTWIKNLEIETIKNNKIVLVVPTKMQKYAIESRLYDLISSAFNFITNKTYEIEVEEKAESDLSNIKEREEDIDFINNSEKCTNSSLNPRYTFDNFVKGHNNEFAIAAGISVSEKIINNSCNPLFIYGNHGVGKTHLMNAIGNKIIENNSDANVLLVRTEEFINDLLNSIKENNNILFRNKYRNIDVLLIEDIQYIAGKKISQEEFYHIFENLYQNGKQIIISADKLPKDIPLLEERLKYRFEWGILTEISMPDYETRLMLLKEKVKENKLIVSDDILKLLADKITSNVMELEGALNRIFSYSSIAEIPITIELAEKCINDIIEEKKEIS